MRWGIHRNIQKNYRDGAAIRRHTGKGWQGREIVRAKRRYHDDPATPRTAAEGCITRTKILDTGDHTKNQWKTAFGRHHLATTNTSPNDCVGVVTNFIIKNNAKAGRQSILDAAPPPSWSRVTPRYPRSYLFQVRAEPSCPRSPKLPVRHPV